MRVVLDTGVLVAAMRSESGASRRVVLGGLDRRYEMLVSVPLMVEYEAVLKRPQHLAIAGVGFEVVDELLYAIAGICTRVRLSFRWRPQLRDPGDEMLLETAVNGRADALITFDRRELTSVAGRFGVQVKLPAALCEDWK